MSFKIQTAAVRDFLRDILGPFANVVSSSEHFLYTTNPVQLGGPMVCTFRPSQVAGCRQLQSGKTLCNIKNPFNLCAALDKKSSLDEFTEIERADYEHLLKFLLSVYTVTDFEANASTLAKKTESLPFSIRLGRGKVEGLGNAISPKSATREVPQTATNVLNLIEAFHAQSCTLPTTFGQVVAPVLLDLGRIDNKQDPVFFELSAALNWLSKSRNNRHVTNIMLHPLHYPTELGLELIGAGAEEDDTNDFVHTLSTTFSSMYELKTVMGQLSALSGAFPTHFPSFSIAEPNFSPNVYREHAFFSSMGLDMKYLSTIDPAWGKNKSLGLAIDL